MDNQWLRFVFQYTIYNDISWCGNFVERHSFRRVSGDSPKTLRKLHLSIKFSRQEVRWNFGVLSSDISFFDQKYPPSNDINWDGINHNQKQPSRGVPRNRCSENKQQIYRRAPMRKCDFTLRHRCSPVNFQHIFRTPFPKNTSGWLLLYNNDIVSWLKD